MGSRFEIIAVSGDSSKAWAAINYGIQEIERIEQLMSSWQPDSETSKINAMSGQQPVAVSKELYDLIFRSLKVSKLTNGAYDISFAGMNSIWNFDKKTHYTIPDSQSVASQASKVDFKSILLNEAKKTVYLSKPGMKIGFGSIGKGYAANRAMAIMKEKGIQSGMVNAGGDLITWGEDKDGQAWSVGIADPNQKNEMISWLALQDMALVTSGDYEKYFVYKDQRYGHILDPRSGYPAKGIKSVSILCPDAELGDALATAVYVMGKSRGMNLINQLKGVEGLIITENDELLKSNNLYLNYYKRHD